MSSKMRRSHYNSQNMIAPGASGAVSIDEIRALPARPQGSTILLRDRAFTLRSGFTLVEMMIVLAIAAVIMAISLPMSKSLSNGQKRSTCSFNQHSLAQALAALRNDYQGYPRDGVEIQSIYIGLVRPAPKIKCPTGIGGAALNAGDPNFVQVNTTQSTDAEWYEDAGGVYHYNGVVGLYSLFYLADYATGRIEYTGMLNYDAANSAKGGPINRDWLLGGNYLRRLAVLHCPANDLDPGSVTPPPVNVPPYLYRSDDPNSASFGTHGYNNYDMFYRRDWFHNPPYLTRYYDKNDAAFDLNSYDPRNLVESAYPPADTLVTFCPFHRRSGNIHQARRGDEDLAVFVDGVVMWLPAYPYADPLNLANVTFDRNPARWFSDQRSLRRSTGG
jgi:prepilin-type N-terminal cleavage/methylation domain-containing protein